MYDLTIWGLILSIAVPSLLMTFSSLKEIIVILRKEYLRRKAAREKYSVDADTQELGILENEFYHPEITNGEIVLRFVLFVIPGINLIFFLVIAARWAWKELKLWFNSPVFPW